MASVRSLNKVMLIGNVTRDPEVRYTPKGTAVCGFSLATNRAWKDATGNKQEEATFHRISAWGALGETLAKIVKKGAKVYVEGILRYSDRRDESGKLIARQADIRADEVVLLDSFRRDDDSFGGQPRDEEAAGTDKVAVDKIDLDSIMEQMDGGESTKPPAKKGKKEAAPVETADDLPF